MSTPAPPPAPTDPLREQLDELDALLQRMLELPVNPADGELPPPAARDPLPPPSPLSDPRPPLYAPVEFRPDEPSRPSAVAVIESPRPPTVAPSLRAEPPPAPVKVPLPELARRPSPPLVLWPLVGVNRLFDRAVSRLGFAGRWMKRPWGRALLGWLGLLCLAAAGVLLLLDWIGWTW
jgi:hypothetical protein